MGDEKIESIKKELNSIAEITENTSDWESISIVIEGRLQDIIYEISEEIKKEPGYVFRIKELHYLYGKEYYILVMALNFRIRQLLQLRYEAIKDKKLLVSPSLKPIKVYTFRS
ncbi:MAG: hypothetical protein PHQ20_03165 [Candidatus Moranbacteria bacterium]|nr:hypothetical protein [Candidatus Moranbacteria bacterium]